MHSNKGIFYQNLKFSLVLFYVFVYLFPAFYIIANDYYVLNFWGTVTTTKTELSLILLTQFFLTVFFIRVFEVNKWKPYTEKSKISKSVRYVIFSICILIFLIPAPSIINYFKIFFVLFLCVTLCKISLFELFVLYAIIGIGVFLLDGGRAILLNALFLLFLYHAKNKINILLFGLFLVLVSVFILLPIRHGEVPNLSFENFDYLIFKIFHSMSPMLISAIKSYQVSMSNFELILDYLPLARTITESGSFIDKIAYSYMDIDKYAEGARLGSNSMMLAKSNLIIHSIVILSLFYTVVAFSTRVKYLSNIILSILLWNFIVIPRRSITTFFSEIIVCIVIFLVLSLLYYLYSMSRSSR